MAYTISASDNKLKGLSLDCFVIMPVKNVETEFIWDQVYQPVIASLGHNPIRSDFNHYGKSLHEIIINYLRYAPILIADLTLARPNCYYEVGYAMGRDKHENLILCCRDDHRDNSPEYKPGSHKVHFDISTYSVIWWTKTKIEGFKSELTNELQKRIAHLQLIPTPESKPKVSQQVASATLADKKVEVILRGAREELKQWKKQI